MLSIQLHPTPITTLNPILWVGHGLWIIYYCFDWGKNFKVVSVLVLVCVRGYLCKTHALHV